METEVTINGTVYVPKESKTPNKCGLKAVLIRSYAAGVHFGYLANEKYTEAGKVVNLIDSRRVWYWEGAASLSQMAMEGVSKPEKCKIAMEVREIEIVNVIETIPLTEKALLNLQKTAIWKS